MSNICSSILHKIFLQHAHEVNTFIRTRWPRELDVADIVQESFLRLSEYPNPEAIQNHRAFLFQTAANVVIDRYRRSETRDQYLDLDADIDNIATHDSSPERSFAAQQELALFTKILEELPTLQQHAFILFRIEEFTHAEIAKRLGISVRSSERFVKLALEHISKRLIESNR
jgi:RNA polymerase sigma factor (sigma-70 family)